MSNFRYRIKKEGLSLEDSCSPDVNIKKYLIFLSKIDDLVANTCKKYANKNNFLANHSFFIGKALITFQYQKTKNIILE
jgi:hypothetical protein